jgi:CheY-like chemotaxis protein
MSIILVVEDEIMILETTSELLELLGHQVFAANNGGRALEILAERQGQVDLVLLDLSLPDMSGYQLLPELAARYPDLKIVICSGALPDELDFANQPMVVGVLNKPFDLNELRDIVGKAVNGE